MLSLLLAGLLLPTTPADADPPLLFERTVIDLGPVSDEQPIRQPFKFVFAAQQPGRLRFEHCHFCPTPEADRPRYVPGQEGFVLLELTTQGKYGDAEANTTVSIDGVPGSSVRLLLKASVRPRIMVRPDFLVLPELPRDCGGEATMTIVSRRPDLEVHAVRSESALVEASIGESRELDDLGDRCRAIPIHIRIRPGAPLGRLRALIQAQTNDDRSPILACSLEADVVGELAAFPPAASTGTMPSRVFSTSFTLRSRSGRFLWPGNVKLAFNPGPQMPACVLDALPGEEVGTLEVVISGRASSSLASRLDGEVIVSLEDDAARTIEELRVPVRLTVRPLLTTPVRPGR